MTFELSQSGPVYSFGLQQAFPGKGEARNAEYPSLEADPIPPWRFIGVLGVFMCFK